MENTKLLTLFLNKFDEYRVDKKHSMCNIYKHLLEIAVLESPTLLDQVYSDYLACDDEGKESGNWFALFHKSIRQCDLYQNISLEWIKPSVLTPEEKIRLTELTTLFHDSKPKHNSEALYNYIKDNKELVGEITSLESKLSKKELKNISGHLDGIFWETIYSDDDNLLFNMLGKFFKDYEHKK